MYNAPAPLLHRLGAAGDSGGAGAGDLNQAQRLHEVDEGLKLRSPPRDLEHKVLRGGVHDLGTESFRQPQAFNPLLALSGHLDQRQLPLDGIARRGQIRNRMHRYEPGRAGS